MGMWYWECDTDRFGDSESDDLTRGISDQIADYSDWRIAYNSRLNRVYLFPGDVKAQTIRTLQNVEAILAAGGAGFEDVLVLRAQRLRRQRRAKATVGERIERVLQGVPAWAR